MSNAIFINQAHRYLHPLSLEVVAVASREDVAMRLGAIRLERLSTAGCFGRLDFWCVAQAGRLCDVNRPATELLLAAGAFTARSVPLLRGRVVLASHGAGGDVIGLADSQISQLVLHANRWHGRCALEWRYFLDARAEHRGRKAHRVSQERQLWGAKMAVDGSAAQ